MKKIKNCFALAMCMLMVFTLLPCNALADDVPIEMTENEEVLGKR